LSETPAGQALAKNKDFITDTAGGLVKSGGKKLAHGLLAANMALGGAAAPVQGEANLGANEPQVHQVLNQNQAPEPEAPVSQVQEKVDPGEEKPTIEIETKEVANIEQEAAKEKAARQSAEDADQEKVGGEEPIKLPKQPEPEPKPEKEDDTSMMGRLRRMAKNPSGREITDMRDVLNLKAVTPPHANTHHVNTGKASTPSFQTRVPGNPGVHDAGRPQAQGTDLSQTGARSSTTGGLVMPEGNHSHNKAASEW
jgi:hypothetical protein